MTTPVQIGYRDWGRQSAQTDTVISNNSSAMVGPETLGMFPTAGMRYINMNLLSGVSAIRAEIEWYADELRTIAIGNDSVTVTASGSAEISFPVRAPFFRFSVFGSAYPCSYILNTVMGSVPFSSVGRDGNDGMLFSIFNTAIGAATTLQLTSAITRMGEAVLSVETGVAGWQARLDAMSMAGVAQFICDVDGVMGRNPRPVFIPPFPIRATVINPGAATTYNLGLVMRPGFAGS